MKYIIPFVLIISFISNSLSAQGLLKPADLVNFNEIDHWPKFKGCTEKSSRDCTFNKIDDFIELNFKKSVLSDSIPEKDKKALVKLFIDTNGKAVRPYVISNNLIFKKEILQILNTLPVFTPGVHKGKTAIVILEFPINLISAKPVLTYKYDDDSLGSPAILKNCSYSNDSTTCTLEKIHGLIMDNFNGSKIGLPKNKFVSALIKLIVNEDGVIKLIVVEGSNKKFNSEAIRILSGLPKFQPAIKDGYSVQVEFEIPVKFKRF